MTSSKYDVNVGDYLMKVSNDSVYYKVTSITKDTIYTEVYDYNHNGIIDNYDICNFTKCQCCDNCKVYTMEQILKILVFK